MRGIAWIAGVLVLAATGGVARADDCGTDACTRIRGGISVVSGFLEVPYSSLEASPTVAGVSGRVGVQLTDRFAVYGETSVTFFWIQIRSALFFEWSPSDFFAVAVGPALDWNADLGGSGDSDGSVGASVRLAFNVPLSGQRGSHGRRRAVSFSAEVTPSYAFASPDYTGSASGFQLGLLGGIGLEFY